MPYINSSVRKDLQEEYQSMNPADAGELNYAITQIILEYFHENGERYQQINDVLGALEGAKLEFYRRLAAPYEDTKIKENGDVY